MQLIYGLTQDIGDGSSAIRWFRDRDAVDALLDECAPDWDETYAANEGLPSVTLRFPDDLDLEACGFRFQD